MPPTRIRAGGRLCLILVLLVLAAAAFALYAFLHLGAYLTKEDPLAKADAILVLAGTRLVRPLEGADLYLEGYAPILVLMRALEEETAINDITRRGLDFANDITRRGLDFASDAERARDLFASMGVPRDAILIPDRRNDSTAEEAITLRELATARGWKRVIVVTSKYHLRRGGFAVRRELRGTDVQVIMRGSRYDRMRGERWWTRRPEVRWVASELPKLIAYMLGLGA